MRRTLLPYAAAAGLVVVLSLAALASALSAGGLLEPRAFEPSGSPTARPSRGAETLSRTGRLAYWRTEPTGEHQLWVANVDGTQRRPLARIDRSSRVSFMRWSPDGGAIAYLDEGRAAVVLTLDGARVELPLPADVQRSGGRFIDLAWSTDGRKLAATARDASGQTSDVLVASAAGGEWRNATGLGNAFLGEWISGDDFLVQTLGGLVAVAAADGTRLRPLAGTTATSPIFGDDGRIYFLAGRIAPTVRDQTVPVINAAGARVWSTTIDGDLQPETSGTYDDVRLAGRWADGRYLAYAGASVALAFLGPSGPELLSSSVGVVERVVLSADRRTAIAFSGARIIRYDLGRPDAPTVLLDGVLQADAWFPRTVVPARASPSPSPVTAPPARYAFALAGLLWVTDATGETRAIRRLQGAGDERSFRRVGAAPLPQWSPGGERLLYFDFPSGFAGAVYITAPNGSAPVRLSDADATGPWPAWTADGNVALATLVSSRDSASFGADGEVRVVTASGARVATFRGREVAIGGGRTFLIDNGKLDPTAQTRAGHAIVEVLADGARRTITDASALAAAARSVAPVAAPQQLSALSASADGTYLAVRLSSANASGPVAFLIVRASDGAPTLVMPGQLVSDIRWSPAGHLVGLTTGLAAIRDAAAPAEPLASQTDGRFAGWSPDGTWFYVARDAGLFAYPVAGGVRSGRLSPIGVPVSAARP